MEQPSEYQINARKRFIEHFKLIDEKTTSPDAELIQKWVADNDYYNFALDQELDYLEMHPDHRKRFSHNP